MKSLHLPKIYFTGFIILFGLISSFANADHKDTVAYRYFGDKTLGIGLIGADGTNERVIDFNMPDQKNWYLASQFEDGRLIVESWNDDTAADLIADRAKTHTWAYDLNTGRITEMFTKKPPSAEMRFVALLPGEKRAIVTAAIERDQRIFIMDIDGDNQFELTTPGAGFIYAVNLSPDNKHVAFHVTGGDPNYSPGYYNINVMTIETKERFLVIGNPNHLYFGPYWSPDGNWLAFQDCDPFKDIAHFRANICIIKPDGSDHKVITQGHPQWFSTSYGCEQYRGGGSNLLQWSPDGKTILFTPMLPGSQPDVIFDSNRPDHQEFVYTPALAKGGTQLCTIDPFTGKITELTEKQESIWIHHPQWSPDGKYIVYSKAKVGCPSELWIMKSNGSDQRLLTKGYQQRGISLGGIWIHYN